jgi:hypothetical protein
MIIHKPEIKYHSDTVTISAKVELNHILNVPEEIYYEFPKRYGKYLNQRGDGLLVSLFLVAMALGEDIEIHAEISPRLYYGIQMTQEFFRLANPTLFNLVEIHPQALTKTRFTPSPKGVGLSFSGGVDSFFSLWSNLPENQPIPSARITHSVFVLGEDTPLSYINDFTKMCERYKQLFKSLDLEFIPVITNARQFSAERIQMFYMVGSTLYGSALHLGALFNKFYIASGVEDIFRPQHFYGSSYVINRCYSTESLDMLIHAFSYPRIKKMDLLKGWDPIHNHLRVCLNYPEIDGINNCSQCHKCIHTMTFLEILGELDKFTTFTGSIGYRELIKISRKYNPSTFPYLKKAIPYARKNRPGFVSVFHLITLLGWIRVWLLRYLPEWIQTPIKRRVSPPSLTSYFVKPPDEGAPD